MSNLVFSLKSFLNACLKEDAFTKAGDFERGAESFLTDFYADSVQNEALVFSLGELVTFASEFWMFGQVRKPGETLIELVPLSKTSANPAAHLIRVICDDRMFLVDSLVGEISSHGIDVLGLFHPIVPGARTATGRWVTDPKKNTGTQIAESMMMFVIPAQTAARVKAVQAGLRLTLQDVERAVTDFPKMMAKVDETLVAFQDAHGNVTKDVVNESLEFLRWMRDGNFVFLGSRSYDFPLHKGSDKRLYDSPEIVEGSQMGVLVDPDAYVLRRSHEPSTLVQDMAALIGKSAPVAIAKANLEARVHRRVRMDFVSVLRYDEEGSVVGETRFVGLFTVEAYALSPKTVPLLRKKIEYVLTTAGHVVGTHNYKRLDYVLSTYPRDELFQISKEELLRISTGAAQAYDRPRPRIFVRRDPFNRFVSVLAYIPREQYSTSKRQRIGRHLKEAFEGRISAFYPQYSDSPLARVLYIVGMDRGNTAAPDIEDLEAEVAAIVQPWDTGLRTVADVRSDDTLIAAIGEFEGGFDTVYQERFDLDDALDDVQRALTLTKDKPVAVRIYDRANDDDTTLRVKFYSLDARLELSEIMPMFGNMALHVAQETGYCIGRKTKADVWMHDYEMRLPSGMKPLTGFESDLEAAFLATWFSRNENDGFNRLILSQRVGWRKIAFLRLIARYRQQTGMDAAEGVQIEALSAYPDLTKLLIEMIGVRFDPEAYEEMDERRSAFEDISAAAAEALNGVKSLIHDKVLRGMLDALSAGLRTNFYQTDKNGNPLPYLSLKLASADIESLPLPKPYREIYVSSPEVEGVHLRFGPVARGGLRWSDRRDDFRTEVLGLVKAQQVKNAVIVPVGSKGGFYPKQLPEGGDRDAVQKAAISAYTTFISGLLDVTDSYVDDGVRAPKSVVCWDDVDPYLVVAADKGTATFSDIANGIAADYDFWLDDAFASGGSVGYDHKAMGITARGAWEAVKRHFREMGKDIQTEEFDVIGIGDMSGDVFGNGMLLSPKIRLLAAFDHRDIFIDPDPDIKTSFKERKRLFEAGRTSWQDYNTKLISKGGGVFSRSDKSITLTDEMKAMTGVSSDTLAPSELINALLKAPCELLWFGGIGTYVKAESESHIDVGDKANDLIRINGSQLKAKVIGEGANLGMTQAGRIEFALKGGRVNTDAIDNSAGVDSSDNEVNIKILLREAISRGELKAKDRDELLAAMTDDVADLVLAHNYDQTLALSLAKKQAMQNHSAYERLMVYLEKHADLNRSVEGLPDTAEMTERGSDNHPLTRPEIAVLLAYTKNILFEQLIETDVADDPLMATVLSDYFPKAARGFEKALEGHRLRREIITSRVVNQIVDVGGPVFVLRLIEHTNATIADITKAFLVGLNVLDVPQLREQISALDNVIDADGQLAMHAEITRVMQRVCAWMLRRGEVGDLGERITKRDNALQSIDAQWLGLLSPYDQRRAESRIKSFVKMGAPRALSEDVSLLRSRASGFDVVALTEHCDWPVKAVAKLFYDMGGRFKIDRLRAAILNSPAKTHWERLALRHLQEDFYAAQALFAKEAIDTHIANKGKPKAESKEIIAAWIKPDKIDVRSYDAAFNEMNRSGKWTLPKFSIVNAQLRDVMK